MMTTDILCKYAAAVSLCAAVFLFNAHGAPSWCDEKDKSAPCTRHDSCTIQENYEETEKDGTRVDNGCAGGIRKTKIISITYDAFTRTLYDIEYTNTSGKIGCDCPDNKYECSGPFIYQGKVERKLIIDKECA